MQQDTKPQPFTCRCSVRVSVYGRQRLKYDALSPVKSKQHSQSSHPLNLHLVGRNQIQESQGMKLDRRRAAGSSEEALSLIRSAARLVSDIPVSRSTDKQEKSYPSEDLPPLSEDSIRYTGRRNQVFHLGRDLDLVVIVLGKQDPEMC